MSRYCRVLQKGKCEITQGYTNTHHANDLVGEDYTLDFIVAHSDGKVIQCRTNYMTNDKTGNSYGNYVKISHANNYHTLYAHIKYGSIKVRVGDYVKRGDVIGFMGNTGHSTGAHLHFEVYRGSELINPTIYLTEDLPKENKESLDVTLKYKIGDIVNINSVYVSSESLNKLTPAKTKGTITKIIKTARNPYLLDNGDIGWINDSSVVSKETLKSYKTITNCSYLNLRKTPQYGNNVYKCVKEGTRVEYLGKENGWAKIRYDNRILYCGANYLK